MAEKDLPILIGWKEIGAYLNCSPSTAMRRVDDGLPVFRVGGSVRAFADDIDRWLEGERLRKLEAATEADPASPGIVVEDTNLLEAVSTLTRDKKARRYAVIPLGIDTSELERIESRLLRAEEKYRWLVETVPAWIWETDAAGEITYSNVASVDILGYRPEELRGFTPQEFLISPKDAEKCAAAIGRLQSRLEVVRDMQCRYLHRDGSEIWLETDAEPIFDAHGQFKGIRGISRDVTARRRAEEALRASEEKFRTLSDNVPVGIYRTTADPKGLILSANPAFARMFGYDEPASVIGQRVVDFYADPACRDEFVEAIAHTGSVQDYEARLKRKGGEEFWASISARAVPGDDGKIAHIDGVMEDVTARREAEDKIREQNEFLNTVLSSLTHSFYVINVADYKVLLANEAAMVRGVREGGTCYELTHMRTEPCNTAEHPCPLRKVVDTRQPVTVEHVHYHEGCGPRIYEIHAHPIFDERGDVVQIIEYSLDITARKNAERDLRLTQFSVDRSADAAFWVGPDGRFLYVNDAACRSLGYTCDELRAMGVPDIDPEFPAEAWPDHWKEVAERGSFSFESRHQAKDGRIFPVEITVNYLEFEGREYNFAFARDVTDRKGAEEALRESEERYRVLFEGGNDAVYVFTLRGDGTPSTFVEVNDEACRRLGYSAAELHRLTPADLVPPERREAAAEKISQLVKEKVLIFEWVHLRKDGTEIPVEISSHLFEFRGEPTVISVVRDITERMRAEKALRESGELYRNLVETSADSISFVDLNGNVVIMNGPGAALLGFDKPEEVVGRNVLEFAARDEDREGAAADLRKILEGATIANVSYDVRRKDGSTFAAESSASLIRDGDGAPTGFIAVTRDITERKAAEEALRASEEKLRRLVEHSYDGVVLMDEGGTIIEYNAAHERITGVPRDEALGRPIWDALHRASPPETRTPENYKELKNMIAGFLATGEAPWLRHPLEAVAVRPDGERRIIEQLVFPIRTEKGFMAGTVTRDITDFKRTEEALRESEAYLRAAMDNLPFDLFALDETGRYTLANAALREQWGNIVGRRPEDFAPDEATLALWHDNNRRALTGEVIQEEVSFTIRGEERFFYNVISPIYAGDEIRGLLGVNVDITARKRAEEALRERETLLHTVIANAPVALYAYDRDGTVTLCEGQACYATGYGPGELVGVNVFEKFGPEAPVARPLRRALDGEKVEILLTASNDRLFEARYTPVYNKDGAVVGALAVGTDVTEGRRSEEKLRVTEATLREILNAVSEGLSFTDPEETIVLASREFASALGFEPAELEGKSLADFTTPKKLAQMRAETEKRRRGESSTYRTALRHKNGSLLNFTVHCSPLFADDGTFLGTFAKVVPDPP